MPPLGRIVVVSRQLATHTFDSSTWELECTGFGCIDGDGRPSPSTSACGTSDPAPACSSHTSDNAAGSSRGVNGDICPIGPMANVWPPVSARSSVSGAGLPDGGVLLFGGSPSPAQTFSEAADCESTSPSSFTTARSAESWVWDGGAAQAPGRRCSVRTDPVVTRRRPDDVVVGLEARWRSSASRTNDTSLVAVQPQWWDGDNWVVVGEDRLLSCGASCVGARLDGNETIRALNANAGRRIEVALTTAPNGPAPGRSVLMTDGVEVQLTWRRPAGAVP